jgi:CheY-specific phosphatase CheX
MKALKILLVVALAMTMAAPSAFAIHEDDIAEVLSAIGISFAGYVRSRVNVDFDTTEGAAADGGDLEETVFGGEAEGAIDFMATSPMGDMGGMVATAKVTLLMENGGAQSDDAWVALSNDTMELKTGRFEAEDLHGFGEDFYVPEAPGAPAEYLANAARGRADSGGISLTMNTSDAMMVSVGGVVGGANYFGIRPLIKLSTGAVTLTAGGEYYVESATDNDDDSQDTVMGFGGKAEFGMGAMGFGVAGAYGIFGGQDADGNDLDDDTTLTVTGWMTMAVGEAGTLGLGARYVVEDLDAESDDNTGIRVYASYKVKPFMNDNMRLDIGGGYGGADLVGDVKNSSVGVAARLRYDF